MFNKINIYIFFQILKSCSLLLFIFLAITWLLQLTRLFSLTNLIQIDVLNIIYLSLFLIPNLLSVIIPFILIFGILLCFVKLNRDKETIAIYSLGLQLNPIKYSLIIFSSIIIIFYILLNFFMAPIIYEKYKMKEFELRNTIDFNKIVTSNFLKLNKNTILDFKKNKNFLKISILITMIMERILFLQKGLILDENDQFIFKLENGFKLNFNENKEVEKLEFENYILKFENENVLEFNKFDRNTFTVFEYTK